MGHKNYVNLRREVRRALIGTAIAAAAPAAFADTITVNSTGDMMMDDGVCTLREAITLANNDGADSGNGCSADDDGNADASFSIVFASGIQNATITLGGSSLPTIQGDTVLTIGIANDDDNSVTIDAASQSRILANQGQLTLNDLTLVNGVTQGGDASASDRSGGAILNNGGVLVVNGGAMNNNTSDRAGGAIEDVSIGDDDDDASVTLNGVSFSGNDAGGNPGNGGVLHVTGSGDIRVSGGRFSDNVAAEGGALWNNGGTMSISGARFQNNRTNGAEANQGGGALFGQEGAGGTIEVSNTSFIGNTAGAADDNDSSASGGAILMGEQSTLTITNSVFRNNTSRRAGGAIEVRGATSTRLDNVVAIGNDAGMNPGNGGVLHVSGDGDVDVIGGEYRGNTAVEGGAFWNNQGVMTLNGVLVAANEATGDDASQGGGGLFAQDGNDDSDALLRIANSRIIGNTASGTSGSGGGINVRPGATLRVVASTIAGNSAQRAGGGIEVADGDATLVGVTLGGTDSSAANDAGNNPGNGGGLHIGGSGSATIDKSSVGYNTAVEGGGLWNSAPGDLDVSDTTVANNTATRGAGIYQSASAESPVSGDGISLSYVTVTANNGTGLGAGVSDNTGYDIESSLISNNDTDLAAGIGTDDDSIIGNVVLDGGYRLFGGATVDFDSFSDDGDFDGDTTFRLSTPTQPIARDSAAVDVSDDCDDTDQRGFDRDVDIDGVGNDDNTCDVGAFEVGDNVAVVQTEAVDVGNPDIGTGDTPVAVVGLRLSASGQDATIDGFSGYIDRNDALADDIELAVRRDEDGNGRFEANRDMSDLGSVERSGNQFSVTLDNSLQIADGDSVTLFLVATRSASDAAGMLRLGGNDTELGRVAAPVFAGGALLMLAGLASVGGVRRRTRMLMALAAIAVMLTACDNDDDFDLDNEAPSPDATVDLNTGEAAFVITRIDGSGSSRVIGANLPVSGPAVTVSRSNDTQ